MQYELYVDVFFLLNFMMDYLVLYAVNKILKYHATYGYIFLGAFAGSVLVCLIICLPFPHFIKALFLQLVIQMIVIRLTFRIQKISEIFKTTVVMYFVSFLYGGIMTWLRQFFPGYMKIGSLFFCIVTVTYFMVDHGMRLWERLWKIQNKMCKVTLCYKTNKVQLSAMIDSGNELFDQVTGKPVHIIGKNAIKKLTSKEKICKFRYITYHTVENKTGIMPLIEVESMCIHNGLEKKIENPLLAVSERQEFGKGAYDIILHPADC